MHTAEVEARPEVGASRMLGSRLDVLLAGLLGLLSLLLHWINGKWLGLPIDLIACAAAAFFYRFPRLSASFLALTLIAILFGPEEWATIAEHAPLIPILGMGIRDERRRRAWFSTGYALILCAFAVKEATSGYASDALALLVLYGILIPALWLFGDLFMAYRRARDAAHEAELREQRIALARELHDTVARDLARASLRSQNLARQHDLPEVGAVTDDIQSASAQLRWMLVLLREPAPAALGGQPSMPDGAEAIFEAAERSLAASGFVITLGTEGDLAQVPIEILPVLQAVIGEGCANIERHADPTRPCAILVDIDPRQLSIAMINTPRSEDTTGHGLGLTGARERLNTIGGELTTEQEGTQWITTISIPLSSRP